MDTAKKSVARVSMVMMIGSLALSIVTIALTALNQIYAFTLAHEYQFTYYHPAYLPLSFLQYLQAGGYAFVAYIFYRIRKEQTPFSNSIAKQLKVLALVFFSIQTLTSVPSWIMEYMSSFSATPLEIPQYLLITFTAFAISIAIYGFALIFQYGAALQKDTNEII